MIFLWGNYGRLWIWEENYPGTQIVNTIRFLDQKYTSWNPTKISRYQCGLICAWWPQGHHYKISPIDFWELWGILVISGEFLGFGGKLLEIMEHFWEVMRNTGGLWGIMGHFWEIMRGFWGIIENGSSFQNYGFRCYWYFQRWRWWCFQKRLCQRKRMVWMAN